MDPRRPLRTVIDPKFRQVGFITAAQPPSRSRSAATSLPPVSDHSGAGGTLSPVMIPPPRHSTLDRTPASPLTVHEVSGSEAESVTPMAVSPMWRGELGDWEEDEAGSGERKDVASVPSNGLDVAPKSVRDSKKVSDDKEFIMDKGKGRTMEGQNEKVGGSKLKEKGQNEKVGGSKLKEKGQNENVGGSKLKEKTSKAERRAIQEAQRAAKAAAKETGTSTNGKQPKVVMPPYPKKEGSQIIATPATPDKKVVDHLPEKNRKKEAPHPRMQFDDKDRVEKAKKRAIVNQREAGNIVELFRHLPQYVHGTLLPDLETKIFHLESVHPSVYKVGLKYLSGDVTGGNARCIAMLLAFRDVIWDYSSPSEKTLHRDLTAKIGSCIAFLIECRPLSISMGNAIRYLKNRIAKIPLTLSVVDAKLRLQSDIDAFINEKIVVAGRVIVEHAMTKINDGNVLLTHGFSCVVEMILLSAYESGKQFRVVVVDSRPQLKGQSLLRRLIAKGINCTYTHINAISYIMHEVTHVFLGASSVFSNGTVYSRVGTACVALVAHAFHVPVLICCEAYKFHDRVQLDSICFNELGNPDVVAKVSGREDLNYLDNWANKENLQLLNLTYDLMPSDYVSMVITEYGMLPPTSIPVIVRQYCRENIWL